MNRLLKCLSVLLLLAVPVNAGVLTLRQVKGSAISNAEYDANWSESYSATAHGFTVGTLVYKSGASTWAKAIATAASTYADGVVVAVPDANTAYISLHFGQPFTKTAHGLGAAGTAVYLSDSVAGAMTASVTDQQVGQVLDANTIIFGTMVVGGGGGSGDITDVWGCTTGNCNALTAAAGDSQDATSADTTVPWKVNNTAAPTVEGQAIWDADDNRLAVGDGAATKILYPGLRAVSTTDGGAATTATALAANGANCGAGNYPLGVDASGAVETCTADDDVPDAGEVDDTALAAGAVDGGNGGEIADASITADDLASDSVTEAKLKMVNAATDEQCLTYESTTGDFEWQACGTGSSGVLHVDTTTVGNVTTGEDNLITYSLPAGTLAADGDSIEIEAFGTTSADNETKRVRCYFGSTAIIDSTGFAGAQARDWRVTSTVVRTGAATQRSSADFLRYDATNGGIPVNAYTTPAETLSGAVTIKCTGEATTTNAITQTGLVVHSVGGGGGGGSSIVLDINDDGGNDSTGVTELSDLNNRHGELAEPSADEAQIDWSKVGAFAEYDPDRHPTSCASCDEFIGGEALTWAWFNQTSATSTAELDGITLVGDTPNDEIRGRCIDIPAANTDFVVHAKIESSPVASGEQECGLMLLTGGTLASPTEVFYIRSGTVSTILSVDADYSITNGGISNLGSAAVAAVLHLAPYFRLGYVDSTRAISAWYSTNGFVWVPFTAGGTSTADPTKICTVARENATCHYSFFRVRTDGSKLNTGE